MRVTQRKGRRTETESSSQTIYRADVVLVKLLIIEVVVGIRLHLCTPLCLSLLRLVLSLFLLLLQSWLTTLYLPPQTSHLQHNYPRGRHQAALHSTAVGGGVQSREMDGGGGEEGGREGGREKMLPAVVFFPDPQQCQGVTEAVCFLMAER